MKLHPDSLKLHSDRTPGKKKNKKRHLVSKGLLALTSLASLLSAPAAFGQAGCSPDAYSTNKYWWVGTGAYRAAIDFRSGSAVAVATVIGQGNGSLGSEGTSSVVHPETNQLLMVTDGNRIYRGTDGALAPGAVGGNTSSTEAAAIIPQPGGTLGTQFVVFGNTSAVEFNGAGNLNATGYNITTNSLSGVSTLLTGINEALEVVPHTNGTDYWILVSKNGRLQSHLYSVYGFNSAPASTMVYGGFVQGFGSISWSPLNNKLLVASSNGSASGVVGIADFNRSTGAFSNYQEQINPYMGINTGYMPALSPNGRYIFFSAESSGTGGGAFAESAKVWDIQQQGVVKTLSTTLAGNHGGYAGVKIGPDNRVYWTGKGSTRLVWLSNPDNPTTGAEGTITLGASHLGGFSMTNNTYFACATLTPCTNPSAITVTSSSSSSSIAAGGTASYSMTGGDVSGGTPTYTWAITPSAGVTPSSGTGKNTGTVTFANPGNYQVVFTATNSSVPTGCAVGSAGSNAGGVTSSEIVQEVWNQGADLSITKTASATNVVAGQAFAYTLTATNNGPGAATNVVVKDTVPAGLTITGTPVASGGGVVSVSGQTVTTTWPTMANGASQTVTINVTKN